MKMPSNIASVGMGSEILLSIAVLSMSSIYKASFLFLPADRSQREHAK